MDRIKTCLMHEQPGYWFDITLDNIVIAKCHMPTTIDYERAGIYDKDVLNSHVELGLRTIVACIDEWAFDNKDGEPIDVSLRNFIGLDKKYQDAISDQVKNKISEWNNSREKISKN